MNLEPWQPIGVPTRFQRKLDRLFREVIKQSWDVEGAWQPAVDVFETEDAYLIEADLPGVKPEDLQVILDGPLLTICGTRQSNRETQYAYGVYCERASGRFCRSVLLQQPVDRSRMTVEHDNGIFHIRLPKQR